ncbi:MAG TPA: efflux RND transporter periplasmic adaptor subunit [Gemmatimonadales bacterium]|nr:efflux RND transporter periplasmic adaptor subunit [Gemmatimonadales bacterium]
MITRVKMRRGWRWRAPVWRALGAAAALAVAGCGPHDGAGADAAEAGHAAAGGATARSDTGGGAAHSTAATDSLTAEQRARLQVTEVKSSTFHPTVEVTGTVAFNGDISTQVLAPISGPVSRLLVEPGARVRRGDALALVASPDYAAAVAGYMKAEATAANLQRIADLDAQLFQHDALARRDLEQAQTDAATAAADRAAALEQLRSLGVDSAGLDAIRQHRAPRGAQGVVRAPISGTVVERLITPGQLLQANTTPCFTVADLSSVWAMANVFEGDLPYVATGDSAEVRLTGDTTRAYPGVVTYVGALVDPNTRATAVRVLTPNPDRTLKRDMFVRVSIRSHRPRTGLVVPASAVLRDADNLPFVYLALPGGGYARRPVQLGAHVGDRLGAQFEITGGLAAGDRIVTQGGLFMQFAENQ